MSEAKKLTADQVIWSMNYSNGFSMSVAERDAIVQVFGLALLEYMRKESAAQ